MLVFEKSGVGLGRSEGGTGGGGGEIVGAGRTTSGRD